MKKILIFLTIFFAVLTAEKDISLNNKLDTKIFIQEIESLNDLQFILTDVNPEALVLFDIDDTILNYELQLTEDVIVQIIKELTTKKIKVLGLTSQFSTFRKMERYHKDVSKFDIKFYWDTETFDLHDKSKKTEDVKFHKGIIFTNAFNKGLSLFLFLQLFLETMNWIPKEILFVDNILENLEHVKEIIEFHNRNSPIKIDFYGFHYKPS